MKQEELDALKAQLGATEVTHHPATETSCSQVHVNFDHAPMETSPQKSFETLMTWLDSHSEVRAVTSDEYIRSPDLWRRHADEQLGRDAEDQRIIAALRGYAATAGEHTAATLEAAAARIEELLERDD